MNVEVEVEGEDVMCSGNWDVEGAAKTVDKLSQLSSGVQWSRRKDMM